MSSEGSAAEQTSKQGRDKPGEGHVEARGFWNGPLLSSDLILSPAHALTQQELVAKLQAAGYSQVGEGKSTAEGTVVKAVKDGKEVTLVVDSSGQIQERR